MKSKTGCSPSNNNKLRIIFEIANNHQGSQKHFESILNDILRAIDGYRELIEFAVKFQFRDIPTFIDETVNEKSNKHIKRFRETTLSDKEWHNIINLVKNNNLVSIVTPFDEQSVKKALSFGVDEFKIASCSSTEWTLIEKVIHTDKPITISTGGRNLSEVDKIYSYFAHRIPNKFTIMHCCGIYPAEPVDLNLSTISKFKSRYPLAKIGYSGHESPSDHFISSMAVTLGAISLERHIGKPDSNNDIYLNKYSVDSEFISDWLKMIKHTLISLGTSKRSDYRNSSEIDSLLTLQRGVFLNDDFEKGSVIDYKKCKFKFPIQEKQISASEISSSDLIFIAKNDLKKGQRLLDNMVLRSNTKKSKLINYVHKIRGILNENGENISKDTELEISHHYGIDQLEQIGCCLVNIVNRSYCKKLIIMTEGQKHPTQFHNVKEELFRVLYGKVELVRNGEISILNIGDEALVRSDIKHSFSALTDCIIEEISTTSLGEDSFYIDEKINKISREERKTFMKLHLD